MEERRTMEDNSILLNAVIEDIKKDIGTIAPFESEGQFEKRKGFLANLMKQAVYDSNGNIESIRALLPRIAVLSSAFYNVKVLGCRYDSELENAVACCDPEKDDYATQVEREKHSQKCRELKIDMNLFC